MSDDTVQSYPLHLPPHIFLLDGLALVILLLAPSKGYKQFCVAIVRYIQFDSYDSQSFLLDRTTQLVQFLTGKEQLAVPARVVLSPGAPPVVGNVHVLDIELPVVEIAEAVHQRGLARPDGLYLRPGKDYTRLICLYKLVVERCTAVLYLDFTLCFRHNQSPPGQVRILLRIPEDTDFRPGQDCKDTLFYDYLPFSRYEQSAKDTIHSYELRKSIGQWSEMYFTP